MIRVLLVDDSKLVLMMLRRILALTSDIEVVGTAGNGQEALAILASVQPDVICTDYRMPVMDGLAFTKAVMATQPCPILVLSVSVQRGDTDNIFKLIQAGAIDVMAKPRLHGTELTSGDARLLIQKIRILAGVRLITRPGRMNGHADLPAKASQSMGDVDAQIIGIGASTGGPQALLQVLKGLPADFPLPIVCVQHISDGFSDGLVQWMARECKLRVQFAESGAAPHAGHVYFAPESAQLEFNARGQFVRSTRVNGFRHCPSISVTLQAMAACFGRQAIGVLLTGMGRDGVDGLKAIKDAGGLTIAQDQASCVVFGMPQEAIKENAASIVLPLAHIGPALLKIAGRPGEQFVRSQWSTL